MAADASKPTGSADSYIGSFISLTSKSDIRYEGVLFHINTQESSVGLKNVRSFGTEGRKNDGPQILPSDKVFEYIFFRGTDIKDLQVISSPPIQSAPAILDDPAIIQMHYPHPASVSTSLPPAGTGSVTNLSSTAQLGLPSSTFQGSLPLYQPVENLGSWGSSPSPPIAGVSGLTMPMYWQGFNGPSGGLSNLQQQSLLRPEPGLVESPPLQQQTQYPSMNVSLPRSASNFPEFPRPLLPSISTGSPNSTSTLLPPSTLPSNFPIGQSAALTSNLSPNLMPSNAPTALPMPSVVGTSSSNHTKASVPFLVTPGQLLQSNPMTLSSSHSLQTAHKDIEVVQASTSDSLSSDSKEAQSSILPLQSPYAEKLNKAPMHTHHSDSRRERGRGNGLNGDALRTHHNNRGHSRGSGYRLNGAALHTHDTNRGHSRGRGNMLNGAALHTHHTNRGHARGRGNGLNGAASYTHHSYRGNARGRGNRISRPVAKFAEDFDFEGMNEKFNKDEVWGHLGKSNKARLKSKDGDEEESVGDDTHVEDEDALPKFEIQPVYVKDDFFDSLSCNPHDRESRRGRANFSEQIKIDTETFGDFQRHRGGRGSRGLGRGGRGLGHGGRSQGSYYGRGYGYAGRGPGRTMLSRVT